MRQLPPSRSSKTQSVLIARDCVHSDQHEERLPFFDDIRGELRRVAAADVPGRVDRSGRDEQDSPALSVTGGLPSSWYSSDAFEDIDDLLARMRVLGGQPAGREIDAHLDDLASGDAEIVPLEIGALDSRAAAPAPRAIAKPLAAISAATAMIRLIFMWISLRPDGIVISVPAERSERGAELGGEELGLLPRREVAALVDLVEIDQVAIGAPGPCLRGSIDLLRKHRDGHRKRDLGGLLRGREK